MRFLIYLLLPLLLTGCVGAGKFAVRDTSDGFTGDGKSVIESENNRISSRSLAGGYHIDDKGVYLNPFVIKSKDNKLLTTGLEIINKTGYSTATGAVNQFGVIQRVQFRLSDGTVIDAEAREQDYIAGAINYNTVGRYAHRDKTEYAAIALKPDQLKAIGNAPGLSVRVVGTRQRMVYEPDMISDGFQKNILEFYRQHVAPAL